jgi:hypothetical protein
MKLYPYLVCHFSVSRTELSQQKCLEAEIRVVVKNLLIKAKNTNLSDMPRWMLLLPVSTSVWSELRRGYGCLRKVDLWILPP